MTDLPPNKPVPSSAAAATLRWFAMLAGCALFVSDFGMDVWAKPVPNITYWIIGAIGVGIDVPQMRDLLLAFLRGLTGEKGK